MTNQFTLANQRFFPPLGTIAKILKSLSLLGLPVQEIELPIWTKRLQHKVFVRPLTSDISAFSQIFIGDEFGPINIKVPEIVLDLGANIGCASIYFLNRWPKAKVIAVEADPANFPLLVKNLKPYGSRAIPVLGAVTDYSGSASIERLDAGHWASRIALQINASNPTVPAFTLGDILSWAPSKRIDLIKMDIEGAETSVLGWLCSHLTEFAGATLALEIHNDEATRQFDKLRKLTDATISRFGEYHSIRIES